MFLSLAAGVWVCCDAFYSHFLYIRPGSDLVHRLKTDKLSRARLFDANARIRVLAFGNSKTMAGFMPAVFAPAAGPDVETYNFGVPGDAAFMDLLQTLLANGARPTHILVQVPWSDAPPPRPWDWIKDDYHIIHLLVPFRDMPRDMLAFAIEARQTGLRRAYAQMRDDMATVEKNRGWYFIKGQSHHPGDRLPADYQLPSDTPDAPAQRPISTASWEWTRLVALARQYHFSVFLIPPAYRTHEFRPSGDALSRETILAKNPDVRIIGPDYYLMPPPSFSDPVHLNPQGAKAYSLYLAALFDRHIAGAGR